MKHVQYCTSIKTNSVVHLLITLVNIWNGGSNQPKTNNFSVAIHSQLTNTLFNQHSLISRDSTVTCFLYFYYQQLFNVVSCLSTIRSMSSIVIPHFIWCFQLLAVPITFPRGNGTTIYCYQHPISSLLSVLATRNKWYLLPLGTVSCLSHICFNTSFLISCIIGSP